MPTPRPFRCLDPRILGISLLMGGALIGLAWIGHGLTPGSAARVAIAIAEAGVFAWFVIEIIRSVRRLDELEQRIHTDAFAGAAAITVIAICGWGFLVKAGVPAVDWSVWIVALLTVTWVLGVVRISRRYR